MNKITYTIEEIIQNNNILNSYKSREKVIIVCSFCKEPFLRVKRLIFQSLKRGWSGFYCSDKCSKDNMGQQHNITKLCDNQCGKQVKRRISQLSDSKHIFCSSSCAAIYNNKNKAKGIRRSKLEIYLENKIKTNFSDLEILCNNKQVIGSELDFYFPTLKFAIELNGIFHYEPIYGNNKLEKIQNNDKQKIIRCYEAGIELLIIDVSKDKYFKISKANFYLNLIEEHLKNILKRM
jgi:hypothetical protein